MIELFSRSADMLCGKDAGSCVPLTLGDEISSLSAILLNEDYYNMLLKGRMIVSDIVVLPYIYLIPFKAKAWRDLCDRKANGQHVDDKDIRKHKNDIVKLATLLTGTESCELPDLVRQDIVLFIEKLQNEPVNLKNLRISGIEFEEILAVLSQVYLK